MNIVPPVPTGIPHARLTHRSPLRFLVGLGINSFGSVLIATQLAQWMFG